MIPGKPSLGSKIITQAIALAFFVGFPALLTAIAPVSWLEFTRAEGGVAAEAKTCLLFIIPYKTQRVFPVTQIDSDVIKGTYVSNKPGERKRSEDEGILIISGTDQEARVQVSPASLESVRENASKFLDEKVPEDLSMFVAANWKFSVVAGGLASLLTVLYVGGIAFGLLMFPLRLAGFKVPGARKV